MLGVLGVAGESDRIGLGVDGLHRVAILLIDGMGADLVAVRRDVAPFLEAIRQFRLDVGRDNTLYIHLTLVPYIGSAGELKTKPTQHSVRDLRSMGFSPTSCSAGPTGSSTPT